MTDTPPAQILCVDDDPDVLAGLQLSLRNLGEVHVASHGQQALTLAAGLPRLAVVLCDMRMPGMPGDEVLACFRQRYPMVARLLLTGYSDMDAAVRAINQGRIFRFLNKPCARDVLQQAVSDALEQHRLLSAERVLLEQTVRGCMQALVDALAMASPASYGQAQRLSGLIEQVGQHCHHDTSWAATMAAMLANLGLVGLRPALQEKVLLDLPLDAQEAQELERGHRRAMALLASIPRIQPVRQLLGLIEPVLAQDVVISTAERERLAPQAELIALVRRYVRLEAAGMPVQQAIALLRGEHPEAGAAIQALAEVLGPQADLDRLLELSLDLLRPGMVLARAIHTAHGLLLAPAGYQINDSFVERLQDACPELRQGRVAVIIPARVSGHLHHRLLTSPRPA